MLCQQNKIWKTRKERKNSAFLVKLVPTPTLLDCFQMVVKVAPVQLKKIHVESITELSIFIGYKNIHLVCIRVCNFHHMGPFNNYMEKMRGEGVKKCQFCPRSGYKNCPRKGGGDQKMAKICPRCCWLTPIARDRQGLKICHHSPGCISLIHMNIINHAEWQIKGQASHPDILKWYWRIFICDTN